MVATRNTEILVVDDETAVTDLYQQWLTDYTVHVANDGSAALDALVASSDEISIALLDRRMPGMGGDEVLAEIRDREYGCMVALITAVTPEYEIIEMPFDDYITKPVGREEVRRTVETLHDRAQYADNLQRYYALVSKHAALATERSAEELERNEAFADLEAEIESVRAELDDSMDLSDHREFQHVLRDID